MASSQPSLTQSALRAIAEGVCKLGEEELDRIPQRLIELLKPLQQYESPAYDPWPPVSGAQGGPTPAGYLTPELLQQLTHALEEARGRLRKIPNHAIDETQLAKSLLKLASNHDQHSNLAALAIISLLAPQSRVALAVRQRAMQLSNDLRSEDQAEWGTAKNASVASFSKRGTA
jgi:hypothetical protein